MPKSKKSDNHKRRSSCECGSNCKCIYNHNQKNGKNCGCDKKNLMEVCMFKLKFEGDSCDCIDGSNGFPAIVYIKPLRH